MADGALGTCGASTAVVIPIHNQARYLADALESVLAQSRPAREVIVVDDLSTDDPAAVVARYPGIRLLRHAVNQGQAGARNTGAKAASARFVLFLDADDVLAPDAIERGLESMAAHPGAGFVYGAYRRVDAELTPIGGPLRIPPTADAYHALLRTNFVGMIATALFDREKLLECGAFDVSLRRCEDYDCYFRMVRRWPVASHGAVVALYRMHGVNQTARAAEMLFWVRRVLERHRPPRSDGSAWRAYVSGMSQWSAHWAQEAWKGADLPRGTRWRERIELTRMSPRASLAALWWQKLGRHLPQTR